MAIVMKRLLMPVVKLKTMSQLSSFLSPTIKTVHITVDLGKEYPR